jgi:hypothetical protein
MVPADLKDFLVACLGSSASFIGLLFVGLSVVLQKTDAKLADTDRILAESSYAGLLNIFFVSLVAILPNASIGYVSLIMAVVGLLTCWRLLHYSRVLPLVISVIIYLLEAFFAIDILTHEKSSMNTAIFETIIITLFATSLIRAWGLTGIRNKENS